MSEKDQVMLETLALFLPVLQRAYENEVGVGLTDKEKFLLYLPAKNLDFRTKVNDPYNPGTGIYKVIHDKLPVVVARLNSKLLGVSYIARSAAIYNSDGEIIGAISMTQSIDRQQKLKGMAGSLLNNISTFASTTEEITAQSQEITGIAQVLVKAAEASQARTRETAEVLNLVRNIAVQTNLLGLNAAIEAARVGEQGRGFSVVAEEIRKLADSTSASIAKISEIMTGIQSDSATICGQSSQVGNGISQVAEAIAHMVNSIEELREMANSLDSTADLI